ncbi:MAG: hypothetical protein AAGI38_12000, partial [Bacteroidota bacterium]
MTFYEKEIRRIKEIVYANEGQVETVIGAKNYLEEHYHADLNLNLLAQTQLVSKFHLLRLHT